MNIRLAAASLLSIAALALVAVEACSTNEVTPSTGDDDGGDAGDGGDDGSTVEITACAAAGYTCTTLFDCDAGVGHIVGDPGVGTSCSDTCCSLGPYSCGGVETFTCTNGSMSTRAMCIGGALGCPTGYTRVPFGDASDIADFVTRCGFRDAGVCNDETACTQGGGLLNSDPGAITNCEDGLICCTTACAANTAKCLLNDGGGVSPFDPSCAATTGVTVCPGGSSLDGIGIVDGGARDATVDAADAGNADD